jgi:oligopeptide transport system substrate-binding protein
MENSMNRAIYAFAVFAMLLVAKAHAATDKVINFALLNEPPQLNSMKATDTQSAFVIGHVMEGLTSYGPNEGQYIPGVAESWEVTDKGATFKLRKNAKWSDGKPVTAKDFVFSWRTTVDPKTASEYAFLIYPVKNAEAINQGKMPLTALGAEAVDDFTLKVTFEKPCGYFVSLTAAPTYMPVREDFHKSRGERYGADATDILYNGPFKLAKWVHGSELEMVRNESYWDQKRAKLDKIRIPYITPDATAQFNFFKDKKTHVLERMNRDDLPKAQQEKMKIRSFADGSVWYMEFNFRPGRVTTNLNLRKAIAAVFNPDEFVNKVVGIPGTKAGTGLIPSWVKGVSKNFRQEFVIPKRKPDIATAKKHLAEALKELKLASPPSLIWLTGDTTYADREAQYFQEVFKKTLGIELKIDKQIFKQRLAKMTAGEFDIVAAGWGPDYADPMTFADLKASWNENNRGKYANAEYDKHIRAAMATSDNKIRMKEMAAAEKIGLDELAILPTYERVQAYLFQDGVTGVKRNAVGPDPYFVYADIK